MKLSVSLLTLLSDQYRHEMSNHLRYVARASVADFSGLDGSAKLFREQARGELGHAEIISRFINDRNAILDPSPYNFDESVQAMTFIELFKSSLVLEENTTTALNNIARVALAEGDFQTFAFIQPLIVEQTEEENLFQTILDRFMVASDDARGLLSGEQIHLIDVWIGSRVV